MISKITKNNIADIRQLHNKKFRTERKRFIVEGHKSVLELFKSDLTIHEIIANEKWFVSNENILPKNTTFFQATPSEMERISILKTPQEVMAIVKTPSYGVQDIPADIPLLVLDNIRDPGNMGTIIRTAEWFGFRHILCSSECVEYTNPKTIQASMGSFCRVKVIYEDIARFLSVNKKKRRVLGAFMKGESLPGFLFQKNDMIIIGNEAQGISEEIFPFIEQKVAIPSSPDNSAESLNAAIATALILYQYTISG